MALGKQAKILTDKQVRAVLAELDIRRYPVRDRVTFLFSVKAGMRAKETASVTWAMVTDADGEITLGEAANLSRLVEGCMRAIEASEFHERLQAIETRINRTKP